MDGNGILYVTPVLGIAPLDVSYQPTEWSEGDGREGGREEHKNQGRGMEGGIEEGREGGREEGREGGRDEILYTLMYMYHNPCT